MNIGTSNLILVLLLLIQSTFSNGQVPTRGLVVYYALNGNTTDGSGNGLHCTLSTTGSGLPILTSDRFNNPNSAYKFNGIDQFIQGPNINSYLNSDSLTLSAWVKYTRKTPYLYDVILSNLGPFPTNGGGWNLLITQSNLLPAFEYRYLTNSPISNVSSSLRQIDLSIWTHLLVTVKKVGSSTIVQNFQDGVLVNSSTFSQNINLLGARSLLIAVNDDFSLERYFQGSLDDIRIYNRALDASEITQLYNENKIDLSNGLQLHIPIQNDVKDYSVNRYTVSSASNLIYSTNRYNRQNDAIQFSGTNYLNTNFKGIGGTGARSFSAWILPSITTDINDQYLLTYGPQNNLNPGLEYYKEIRFGLNFSFLNPNQKNLQINIGNGAVSYQTPFNYYDGKWHLVTYVIPDNAKLFSDVKMYLDCQLLTVPGNSCCGETPPNQLIDTKIDQPNSYNVHIGVLAPVQIPASVSSFKGQMDDIRLYNRELNQNEICALYNLYQPNICNPTAKTTITVLPTSGPMFYSIQKPDMDLVKISLSGTVIKIGRTGLPKSYNSIIGSLKFDKNKTLWYCGVGDSLFVIDTLSGKATFKTTLKHPTLNITNGIYFDAIAFNSNNDMYVWVEPIGPDYGKLFKVTNLSIGTMNEISTGTIPNMSEILAIDFTKGDSLYAVDQCCYRSFHILSTATGLPFFSSSSTNRVDITATSSYNNTIFGLNLPGYQNGTTSGFFTINPATGNTITLFNLPGQYVGLEASYSTNLRTIHKTIMAYDTIRRLDTLIIYVEKNNSNIRKSTSFEHYWKLNKTEATLEWNLPELTIVELHIINQKKKSIPLANYHRIPLSAFTKGKYEVEYKTSDGIRNHCILEIE